MILSSTNTISKKQLISLLLNTIIIIMEIIALSIYAIENGVSMFTFYTTDSNIFALIACIIYLIFSLLLLTNKITFLPSWVKQLKYMATCCLSITFIVVVFILSPMQGADGYYHMLFEGTFLFLHFLCPIFLFVSFIFTEIDKDFSESNVLLTLLPTLIYAVITLTMNITGTLTGPYPFLMVYNQPVYMSVFWFAAIMGIAFLLGLLIQRAGKRVSKRV